MITDEQIKQKWIECTRSHRRGDVISSVDMATELARWAEQQALAENERLKRRIAHMRECLTANRADFLKANIFMERAGLHPFNLAIRDIDAALKELDDA